MSLQDRAKYTALARRLLVELRNNPRVVPPALSALRDYSSTGESRRHRVSRMDSQKYLLYAGLTVAIDVYDSLLESPRLGLDTETFDSPGRVARYGEASGSLGRFYKLMWTLQNTSDAAAESYYDVVRPNAGLRAVTDEVDRILGDYRELRPHPRYENVGVMLRAGGTTAARHAAFAAETHPYLLLRDGVLPLAALHPSNRQQALRDLNRSFAASALLTEPARGSSGELRATLRRLAGCIGDTPANDGSKPGECANAGHARHLMPPEAQFWDDEQHRNDHHTQLPYDLALLGTRTREGVPVTGVRTEVLAVARNTAAAVERWKKHNDPGYEPAPEVGCPALAEGLIRRHATRVARVAASRAVWSHQLDVMAYEVANGMASPLLAERGRTDPTRREIEAAHRELATRTLGAMPPVPRRPERLRNSELPQRQAARPIRDVDGTSPRRRGTPPPPAR